MPCPYRRMRRVVTIWASERVASSAQLGAMHVNNEASGTSNLTAAVVEASTAPAAVHAIPRGENRLDGDGNRGVKALA